MSEKDRQRLEHQLDVIEQQLPDVATGWLAWLRRPRHRLVRIPVGILLVLGGVFSILPMLGLWMLPLGLTLLAIDVPFLQRPTTAMIAWLERTWRRMRTRFKSRR
jgi:hypothetical protein